MFGCRDNDKLEFVVQFDQKLSKFQTIVSRELNMLSTCMTPNFKDK